MALLLTVLAVFLILIANEFWWRKQAKPNEISRKFVHITVGSFVAFWPFFLSWTEIIILSLAFLAVVVVSKYLNLFQAIHSVQRPTWGEIFFALAVGAIVLITDDKWVYTAALLQMSLADGFAAILGSRYGGRFKYTIFGHVKSIFGTATFFVVSVAILALLNHKFADPIDLTLILSISALASLIENIAVKGLDNLLVPLITAVILAHL